MPQNFEPGDVLIFQIESGYGLLRVLEVENPGRDPIWHLAAYEDLFLDVETADAALDRNTPKIGSKHLAITNRAFESTQVARMRNIALSEGDLKPLDEWRDTGRHVSDRSVRLLLGLR